MFLRLGKTPFLYAPDNDEGAGGGQTHVAPTPEQNVVHFDPAKHVSIDKYNGTKGALEQQRDRFKSESERIAGEKEVLATQVAQLSTQVDQFKTEASKATELSGRVTEFESSLKREQDMNNRLKAAMKYPGLLDASILAMVESSTLDAEALENHLGKLAEKLGAKAIDLSAGASPGKPNTSVVNPNDLMREAEELRRSGNIKGFETKMAEALAGMDAKEPFKPPQRQDH